MYKLIWYHKNVIHFEHLIYLLKDWRVYYSVLLIHTISGLLLVTLFVAQSAVVCGVGWVHPPMTQSLLSLFAALSSTSATGVISLVVQIFPTTLRYVIYATTLTLSSTIIVVRAPLMYSCYCFMYCIFKIALKIIIKYKGILKRSVTVWVYCKVHTIVYCQFCISNWWL